MLSLDITGRALRYLMVPARLSALMALCRQDDLEIVAGVPEVPLLQQIKGLNEDLYDVGFAQSYEMGDGILAELTWSMNRPGFRRHLAAINYGLGGGGYEHEAVHR